MRTALSLCALLVGLGGSQSTVAVTGAIADADAKTPVAYARILFARVDGPLTNSIVVEGDEQGRFSANVPAGTYRVFADATNYLRREHSQSIVVAASSPVPAIAIALTRTAVISGRITSDTGTPLSGAFVRAWGAGGVVSETRSNDLGEYRLFGLEPGSYVISAERYRAPRVEGTFYFVPTPPCPDCRGEGESRVGIATVVNAGGYIDPRAISTRPQPVVYFPAAADRATATPVQAGPGAQVAGIDLRLSVR